MAAHEAAVLAQFEQLQERMALTNARYADDEVEADVRQATDELRALRRR